MLSASLTSFKHRALRKAVERLQPGKLLENPSGDGDQVMDVLHHMTTRVEEYYVIYQFSNLFFLLCYLCL